jgi:hypothetical protein
MYFYRMANGKIKRKEVSLPAEVVRRLEKQAKGEKRTLKNWMELILIEQSKKEASGLSQP